MTAAPQNPSGPRWYRAQLRRQAKTARRKNKQHHNLDAASAAPYVEYIQKILGIRWFNDKKQFRL